jgi:tRNA A-37 threonylcarbamoyl transferase component Bud32/tetratricopeptide (TPR) repeat protein
VSQQLRDQLQATLSGSYTLGRELGGGGMSRVFVAEELRLKRKVVVKVLSPELAQGISVERFEREIQTVAALQHANIVPVHTAGDTNGLPYYTMPFVEGESLRARLGRGPLPVTEVIGILRDVSKALAYAHQRGVVHRDIKPDNVLISGGVAVVTDFGIAKAISAARTSAGAATLTQVGTSIGTPAYMAPEQAAGDPHIDHRADIYSLGAMAYELLAGQVVFAGRTPQRMLAAHMGETPKPITEFRADLPPSLADLVMSCLAKETKDRPQQASDIARVLDTITSGGGMQAMPPVLLGGPGMFRRVLAIYAVAFVAVAILAKAAIVGIGLPDWVFPGSLIVMALGLPVVLWTGYVHRVAYRAMTMTPTYTPGGTPSMAQGTIATMALKAAPRMSWYKTTRGVMYAMGAFIVMIGAFMAMRAFGVGPASTLLGTGQLKMKEPIVMTDFSATNGDTSLARVVSFAVRTGLAGSPVLAILDQSGVATALERMKRPRNSRVDLALARDLAAREGVKVIVDGEVTLLGSGYILVARLVTAESGRELAVVRETGEGPKGLIDAADQVARKLRDKVGESLRSVQRAPSLARVTTGSLDALRKYSEASRANSVEIDWPKAARLAREAVTIDPQFAEGWRLYSVVLNNLGAPRSQVDSAMTSAYQFREKLPERERNLIAASYFGTGPGRDRVKAIAAYEAIGNLNNLGLLLRSRREFAKAESLYREQVRLAPTSLLGHGNLLYELLSQGKLESADSVSLEELRRFPNATAPRQRALLQLYFHGDIDGLQRGLDSARKVPNRSDPTFAPRVSGTLALLRGRVGEWRRYRALALAADSAVGRRPVLATQAATVLGVVMSTIGKAPGELTALDDGLRRSPLRSLTDADRTDLWVAQQYAWAGHPDRARAVLAQYRSEVKDTALRREQEPLVHTTLGAIALAERKPQEAITEFRRGDLAPDGPANGCTICLPLYLSRAFDASGMADSAIVQFESYLRTPYSGRFGETLDASVVPGTHERLGQLYEAKGDAAKAAEHYRAFIELWKNADPELQPRVAEARRRLAKLTPVEKPR